MRYTISSLLRVPYYISCSVLPHKLGQETPTGGDCAVQIIIDYRTTSSVSGAPVANIAAPNPGCLKTRPESLRFLPTKSSLARVSESPPLSASDHEEPAMSQATMLGGTFLLTKLLLPALEGASTNSSDGGEGRPNKLGGSGRARVINVSSGGMYTVAGGGVSENMDSNRVKPYDGTLM